MSKSYVGTIHRHQCVAKRILSRIFLKTLFVSISCFFFLSLQCGAFAAAPETLILAVGGENKTGYDPTTGWGRYGNPMFQSTLLKLDADLNIVKDLATIYHQSEDGRTWTINIRDDVKFSNGAQLTAEDVAYTFNTASRSGGLVDLVNLESAVARASHPGGSRP